MNKQIRISAIAYKDLVIGSSETLYKDVVLTVSEETLESIRSLVVEILGNLDEPLETGDGLCMIDRDELDAMTDGDILDNLIPAMKEQAPEFFDEDEDMIEYRYSIDVAVLLKDNFQNLLN